MRIPDCVKDTTHGDPESREQRSAQMARILSNSETLFQSVCVCVCSVTQDSFNLHSPSSQRFSSACKRAKYFYLQVWVCRSKVEGVNKGKRRRARMDLSVYPFQFIDKSILSLDSRPSQPKLTLHSLYSFVLRGGLGGGSDVICNTSAGFWGLLRGLLPVGWTWNT